MGMYCMYTGIGKATALCGWKFPFVYFTAVPSFFFFFFFFFLFFSVLFLFYFNLPYRARFLATGVEAIDPPGVRMLYRARRLSAYPILLSLLGPGRLSRPPFLGNRGSGMWPGVIPPPPPSLPFSPTTYPPAVKVRRTIRYLSPLSRSLSQRLCGRQQVRLGWGKI